MAESRLIQKQLAGKEDLLLGVGTVSQARATGVKTITKLNATHFGGVLVVDTINDLNTLDKNQLDEQVVLVKEDGNTYIYNGTSWVTKTAVENIEGLKTLSVGTIEVLGYYTKGDGGGGLFYWDSTSTEADNGGTIIQATGITTGRWKRIFSSFINVKWFGAKPNTDASIQFQKSIDFAFTNKCKVVFDSDYLIGTSLTLKPTLNLIGIGGAMHYSPKLIATSTNPIFVAGPGPVDSESMWFENFTCDSADVNINTSAFYANSSTYLSQAIFKNITFYSRLRYAINAPAILCKFLDCDFGSYPGTYNNFTSFYAVGTEAIVEPNLNTFERCVFRKSIADYVINISSGGVQLRFNSCDFEKNNNILGVIRYNGAGSLVFDGGYIEDNNSSYFVRTYSTNLHTFLCNEVTFTNVHLNSPADIALFKRETTYPSIRLTGSYGQLNCNLTQDENGLFNQKTTIIECSGNHFAAGTGSYGELDLITVPGYTKYRDNIVDLQGDSITAKNIIGYKSGAGGTVTQLTSKSTTVILNKPTGTIVMHNETLAAGASVGFNFYSSSFTVFDSIKFQIISGFSSYESYTLDSSFTNGNMVRVVIKNIIGVSLSDPLVLSYVIVKGSNL